MLIPSIDLRGGKVVQLIQGEKLAIESEDVFSWVRRFQRFEKVQLIDLDAALGSGDNLDLVKRITGIARCRVGGGVRSLERARDLLQAGATHVIVGSALFSDDGPDLRFAARLAAEIGADRVIAAVDSRGGQVVVKGWRSRVSVAAVDAVRALDPFVGEFLYTHVDTEGLMKGIDMEAVMAVRQATEQRISAAGGITTFDEIDRLDDAGIDAVVGMAIYTGVLDPERSRPKNSDR